MVGAERPGANAPSKNWTASSGRTEASPRLETSDSGEHHVTIPEHDSLRMGALSVILSDIAQHLDLSRDELLDRLFAESLSWCPAVLPPAASHIVGNVPQYAIKGGENAVKVVQHDGARCGPQK